MLITSLLPITGGMLLPLMRFRSRRARGIYVVGITILTSLLALRLLIAGAADVTPIALTDAFQLTFGLDGLGKAFLGLMAFLWPLAALYATEYMEHEEREDTFFSFYTMTYGVMVLFCCARNIFSLYVIYECVTMVTLPLVWHKKDMGSVRAARAYIRYSIGSAAFAFTAMIVLSMYGSGDFAPGGIALGGMPELVRNVAFLAAFFGFGVKAAVFPLWAWLPRASAAPTPVTALLHAVAVVNAGVFAVLRMIYYVFGTDGLAGTWAQGVALAFSVITIGFGAVMAVRDTHVKRKLAYSTVSNLGYMLLGASLMRASGLQGALLHMVCHGLMKMGLFFCIGAVMVKTGLARVWEMRGLARRMPATFGFFLFGAVALMGIPPLCGFVSKFYLASAALELGNAWAWIGVGALLLSTVLTAIYQLSVLLPAFFLPPEGEVGRRDPSWRMLVPLAVLAASALLVGLHPQPLVDALGAVAGM